MIEDDPAHHHYAPAYSFGKVYIRADSIVGLAARTRHGGVQCTYLRAGGMERLVVGEGRAVLAKVRAALPYCKGLKQDDEHKKEDNADGAEMAEPWP